MNHRETSVQEWFSPRRYRSRIVARVLGTTSKGFRVPLRYLRLIKPMSLLESFSISRQPRSELLGKRSSITRNRSKARRVYFTSEEGKEEVISEVEERKKAKKKKPPAPVANRNNKVQENKKPPQNEQEKFNLSSRTSLSGANVSPVQRDEKKEIRLRRFSRPFTRSPHPDPP
jgi:hypothetical protein